MGRPALWDGEASGTEKRKVVQFVLSLSRREQGSAPRLGLSLICRANAVFYSDIHPIAITRVVLCVHKLVGYCAYPHYTLIAYYQCYASFAR